MSPWSYYKEIYYHKQLEIFFVIDKLTQQVDQVELFPFKYNGLDRPGNIHILSSSERRTGQVSAKPCQHKYSVSLPCQLFIFNIHKRKNVS